MVEENASTVLGISQLVARVARALQAAGCRKEAPALGR
jgi:hypothetical protein